MGEIVRLPERVAELVGDVSILTPADGQLFRYDSATQKWKNTALSLAIGDISGLSSSLATKLESSALGPYLTTAAAASVYVTDVTLAGYVDTVSGKIDRNLDAPDGMVAIWQGGSLSYGPTFCETDEDGSISIGQIHSTYGQIGGVTLDDVGGVTCTNVYATNLHGNGSAITGLTTGQIGGMSSYLTTTSAASTYASQAAYLSQTNAASTYLTIVNAASTYQTMSGMSAYLPTASAASTYQTISGMSSYASTASLTAVATLKLNVSNPTYTGTMSGTALSIVKADSFPNQSGTLVTIGSTIFGQVRINAVGGLSASSTISAQSYTGSGLLLTDLNASSIANGMLSDARLSTAAQTAIAFAAAGTNKTATIENPQASENFSWFFTSTAVTVSKIVACLRGGSANIVFTVKCASDRTAAGTTILSGTASSRTTGDTFTSFTTGTIPANSFVWVTTSSLSPDAAEMSLALQYS